ncbi:MAG TPA: four helix bundle protein [Vicinamibacterales bacterium]|nr:four helix bundle protein [Vicinamibacterales bacterium]
MTFSIAVLRLVDSLPHTTSGDVVGRQLAKSATSVGANYRGTCTARSRAEFIAKLGIVVEEADESVYWLDLIAKAGFLKLADVQTVVGEARELRAIFGKSLGTARSNSRHESARSAKQSMSHESINNRIK